VLHGDVAALVGGGAAHEADVDGEGMVEEPLPSAEFDDLDQVLGRLRIELPAAVPRVDVSPQADVRDDPRLPGGDGAEEVGDDSLGPVVRLDPVLDRELPQARAETPVAAHDALDEALVGEVVDAPALSVTLSGGVDDGEVARPLLGDEPRLDGRRQRLRVTGADEAAAGDRGTIRDAGDRLLSGHDLAGHGDLLDGAIARPEAVCERGLTAKPPSQPVDRRGSAIARTASPHALLVS